jgi:hypothetical protein
MPKVTKFVVMQYEIGQSGRLVKAKPLAMVDTREQAVTAAGNAALRCNGNDYAHSCPIYVEMIQDLEVP